MSSRTVCSQVRRVLGYLLRRLRHGGRSGDTGAHVEVQVALVEDAILARQGVRTALVADVAAARVDASRKRPETAAAVPGDAERILRARVHRRLDVCIGRVVASPELVRVLRVADRPLMIRTVVARVLHAPAGPTCAGGPTRASGTACASGPTRASGTACASGPPPHPPVPLPSPPQPQAPIALAMKIAIHFDLAIRTLLYAWCSADRLSQATLPCATKPAAPNHGQLVERPDRGPEPSRPCPSTSLAISAPGAEILPTGDPPSSGRARKRVAKPTPARSRRKTAPGFSPMG